MGPGVLPLMGSTEMHLRRAGQPAVDALAAGTGCTAFLSIAVGEECVAMLSSRPSRAMLGISYRVGLRHPLTVGAGGVAILSARPVQADDNAEVRRARQIGYAFSEDRLQAGARGVAVSLRSALLTGASIEACIGVATLGAMDPTGNLRMR